MNVSNSLAHAVAGAITEAPKAAGITLASRGTGEYILGDPRWDEGRSTVDALHQIIEDAKGGTAGVPALTVRPGDNRPILLDKTLRVDGVAFNFHGNGVGNAPDYFSPGQGTTLRWTGPPGAPMVQFEAVMGGNVQDVHIQGSAEAPPSALVNLHNSPAARSAENGHISFNRVRMGFYPWTVPASSYHSTHNVLVDGVNGDNDQFFFNECVFGGAYDSLVEIKNSQSVWGKFDNCVFGGSTGTTYGATGLRTAASVTLINPQFNGCKYDIHNTLTAQVLVVGHNSENAGAVYRQDYEGSSMLMLGGKILSSPQFIDGENLLLDVRKLEGGHVRMDGVVFAQMSSGQSRPKVKVRGSNSGTTVGHLNVTSVTGLQPGDFDIKGGVGTGRKLRVTIHSEDIAMDRMATGISEEVVTVAPMA